MTNLDILHFEQLKSEVQSKYLENYTPSYDDISKWKGIDIIYFQEDLRKKARGNISEKSFYTYFKTSPVSKLPRIDMLNLLSVYAGYQSWYEFKKQHLFKGEILTENEESSSDMEGENKIETSETKNPEKEEKSPENDSDFSDLQKKISENQLNKEILSKKKNTLVSEESVQKKLPGKRIKDVFLYGISAVLALAVGLLAFKDDIFGKTYVYRFSDADRNSEIRSDIDIKVLKENESPLYFRLKPGEPFYYPTKDKALKMEITSPIYENLSVNRNLETAPKEETIELKPDDYKMAVDYFSKKNSTGEDEIQKKRHQLDRLISDNAVISQIYDSDIYGIETLNKQKYITLVTTPTTSLKNLKVIEMKREKGKIVSIKFKISDNEKK